VELGPGSYRALPLPWIVFLPIAGGFGAYNRYFGDPSFSSVSGKHSSIVAWRDPFISCKGAIRHMSIEEMEKGMWWLGFLGFLGFQGFLAFELHEPLLLFNFCLFALFTYFRYLKEELKYAGVLGIIGLVIAILGVFGLITV
jgi:hypothetical protein